MTANDKLLEGIRSRQQKKTEFNYGILTADKYVGTIQEMLGHPFCYRHFSKTTTSFSDVLEKASRTLVYGNQDMVVDDSDFSIEGIELPKNYLVVFRHILTTPRKDRDGDILRTEGMIPDPKMLLLWQHVHTMPIGKMLAIQEHNSKVLRLVSCVVDMNPLCHDSAVMIENKMGRFSHGFRAIKFSKVKESPGESEAGYDIKEAEIMEESLVSVPANIDAEQEEVLLSLVEGGKLTSAIMKRVGKRIRSKRPISVPVMVDLKLSINGQEISDGKEKQVQVKAGSPKEAHEGDDEVGGQGQEGPSTDAKGVKSILPCGGINGSWEWVRNSLYNKAETFLVDKGVISQRPTINSGEVPMGRFVWLVSTFPDYAIVCAENFNNKPSDTYYKCYWHLGEKAVPEFYGEPKEVTVTVSTEIREKGLLDAAKSLWQKGKKPKSDEEEDEKEQDKKPAACPKCGSEDIDEDGVCQDCGYEMDESEKPEDEEDKKKSSLTGDKRGRVLSSSNEGLIKEALEYLDEGHKMDGVPKPCKACIGHAKGNLSTVMGTLGTSDEGEASSKPVEKEEVTADGAAILFLASSTPADRKKMEGILKHLVSMDEQESVTRQYLALAGQ